MTLYMHTCIHNIKGFEYTMYMYIYMGTSIDKYMKMGTQILIYSIHSMVLVVLALQTLVV